MIVIFYCSPSLPLCRRVFTKRDDKINRLLTLPARTPLHAMSFDWPMLSRLRQRRAGAVIFAHVLLVLLRTDGGVGGRQGFTFGFLLPVPPAA